MKARNLDIADIRTRTDQPDPNDVLSGAFGFRSVTAAEIQASQCGR